MCSHGYFYRGNKKQNRTTLKNINFVLLQMSHLLKYRIRVVYCTEYPASSFLGGRGNGGGGGGVVTYLKGALIPNLSLKRGANSKLGACLKLGANSNINSILIEKSVLLFFPMQFSKSSQFKFFCSHVA